MTISGFDFRVAEINKLNSGAIVALATGELTSVRFPKWCSEEVCQHFAKQASAVAGVGYADEPGFLKVVGGAAYDAANDRANLPTYLNSVRIWTAEYRKMFDPYASPVDRLRLELQEIWPHGCELQRFHGKCGFSGLVRAFEDGGEARIHQDMTHWDVPDVPEVHEMSTQISAVIYLTCAQQGGDLELWDRGFTDRSEYDRCRIPGDYSIDRKHVGDPAIILTPRVGEMILFNARKLHAVSRVSRGKRSSQSTFIGFGGVAKPLTVFS